MSMFEDCEGAASPLEDLSPDELGVWLGFARAHGAIVRGLDDDLRAAHGLPLSEFKILLWLSQGSCARMRMAPLADMAGLSPSGLSRAIERLEQRGLVNRQQSTRDRRGVDALLTDAGSALVQHASTTHAEGIRRRFLEHLSPAERAAIGPACERVRAANERPGHCPGNSPVREDGSPGSRLLREGHDA